MCIHDCSVFCTVWRWKDLEDLGGTAPNPRKGQWSKSKDLGGFTPNTPTRGRAPLTPLCRGISCPCGCKSSESKTVGHCPTAPQGAVVKASSLREDGFAAALSWRCSYPLTPLCEKAIAFSETKYNFIPAGTFMSLPNGFQGRNSLGRVWDSVLRF